MSERKPISLSVRYDVFKRDNFTCQYCGRKPPEVELHLDHIIPVAKGGTNEYSNLITSCKECNVGKGAKLPTEIRKTNEKSKPITFNATCATVKVLDLLAATRQLSRSSLINDFIEAGLAEISENEINEMKTINQLWERYKEKQ